MSQIFVAGATGVLGRAAVTELLATGHEVSAVARTRAKAAALTAAGARPVEVDVFDAAAVAVAVKGHDVVCNLATHIPRISRAPLPGAWAENDRLRREASRNLVDGALAAGAALYIQESITFLYPDRGDAWIDEDVSLDVVGFTRSVLDAEAAAARFTQSEGTGVVLRFAAFYGPHSHHTESAVRAARRRVALQMGEPDSYLSSIHTDDAGRAVAAAINARVPAGIYNVGDDQPVTRRAHADLLADAVGVARVRLAPAALGRLGGQKATMLMRSQRVSNRRFASAAGWSPTYPSVAEGLPPVVAAILNRM